VETYLNSADAPSSPVRCSAFANFGLLHKLQCERRAQLTLPHLKKNAKLHVKLKPGYGTQLLTAS